MLNPIPRRVKKIWDEWNIRGLVLFSLSLQTFLILFSPLRKRTANKWIIMLTWLVYLLADSAAMFAVGLISDSQRDAPENSELDDLLAFWPPFLLLHLGGPDTITAFALEDNELWLRHALGFLSQVIATAYVFLLSFAQSKLVLPTILMFLAGIIKYFERTRALYLASLNRFRDSKLKKPDPGPNYAKLMDDISSKKEANLPTTIIIKEEHSGTKANTGGSEKRQRLESLDDIEVVHYAYHYFEIFRGLIVDLIFSFQERNNSRDFFHKLKAEDALRVIEVELNFIYEVLYTKAQVVHSRFGYLMRFISFASVVVSLSVFYFQVNKSGFHKTDVKITYILFLGAIILDVLAFSRLIFSDWIFAALFYDPKSGSRKFKSCIAATIGWFLIFRRPRCYQLPKNKHSSKKKKRRCKVSATNLLFGRWSGNVSGYNLITYCLKERPADFHNVSNSVDRFIMKFIPGKDIHFTRFVVNGVSQMLGLIYCKVGRLKSKLIHLLGLRAFVDEIRYVSDEPLTKQVWEFIYEELCEKSFSAENPEDAKNISLARGEWILKKSFSAEDPEDAKNISSARGEPILKDKSDLINRLLQYLTSVTYDESLLLWHIATELLYKTEDEEVTGNNHNYPGEGVTNNDNNGHDEEVTGNNHSDPGEGVVNNNNNGHQVEVTGDDHSGPGEGVANNNNNGHEEEVTGNNDHHQYREFSKLLSDYMLYLLVMQPDIMSVEAGIGKIRFQDTCAEAKRLFTSKNLGPNEEKEACEEILDVNLYVKPVMVKGDRSKSVLFDASELAQVLNEMDDIQNENKWRTVSKVWVELLSYAACNSIGRAQAQQVSKGGELIAFIWLLIAHFGIGRQFQINRGQGTTKLIVNK